MPLADVVVVERLELERLRASARAWKRCAKEWRRSSNLQAGFAAGWYESYRRAWGLEPTQAIEGARPFWGFVYELKRRLFGSGLHKGKADP